MRRSTSALAAMLAVVLLAGCQPGTAPTPTSPSASTVSPVPTPTYQCTPEAGGEATPCTQIHYEEMKAKDRLYAEAEAVFREFFTENIRISRSGGVTEPTDVILATTEGVAREEAMAAFSNLVESKIRAEGEDPKVTIHREPGLSRAGSIVTLRTCVDGTGWGFYRGKELVSEPGFGEDRVYFSRIGQSLKMTYVEGRKVDTCDA